MRFTPRKLPRFRPPRMGWCMALAVVLLLGVARFAPQNLPVIMYKGSLLTLASVGGQPLAPHAQTVAMALHEQDFTDLILLPDGRGLLKGVPGHDQQLVPVRDEDAVELTGLPGALESSFLSSVPSACEASPGVRRHPDTIRFEHCDVRYRVCDADEGGCWPGKAGRGGCARAHR